MQKLHLALDWTPNINHIGFFIAQEKGFYAEKEIDLKISDPSQDNYAVTPAKKVELQKADVALCPLESILSYKVKSTPFHLKAIATIYKQDVSAIAVTETSRVNSPKDLDGKKYASYQARYEDFIVKKMIVNDGGKGDLALLYPAKLGIWNTLLNTTFDATWIFLPWEGADRRLKKHPLRYFKLKDYNIPYSYSPVIAVSEATTLAKPALLTSFLKATKKGFLFAQQHPEEAIAILTKYLTEEDKQNIDLQKSLQLSTTAFGNEASWGVMEENNVTTFLNWLHQHGIEKRLFISNEVITNQFLIS